MQIPLKLITLGNGENEWITEISWHAISEISRLTMGCRLDTYGQG